MSPRIELAGLFVGLGPTLFGCRRDQPAAPAEQPSAAKPAVDAETPLPPSQIDTQLPPAVRDSVFTPFMGDLDEMVNRRPVRMGVTFNRTYYFVDRASSAACHMTTGSSSNNG